MAIDFIEVASLSIAPLKWAGVLSTIVAGAIIGLERQIKRQAYRYSHRRTYLLFGHLCVYGHGGIGGECGVTDPSRVIGQIITGIGFLGAGVIYPATAWFLESYPCGGNMGAGGNWRDDRLRAT